MQVEGEWRRKKWTLNIDMRKGGESDIKNINISLWWLFFDNKREWDHSHEKGSEYFQMSLGHNFSWENKVMEELLAMISSQM